MENNYVDLYGRWHTKPITDSNPLPTNNAYIYSFYASMVGLPVASEFGREVELQLVDLYKTPLTRHPGIAPPEGVAISHDEYVGVAGLRMGCAEYIRQYGESNYWQFCDIPGFTPTPFRKLVIDDVIAAYEDLANEENPRLAVIKFPAIWPLAFWHRPEQQYFYYRCAGKSPGLIRSIYFFLASLVSILSKDQTSPMFFFKTLKFKSIGPNWMEKALTKLYTWKVDYKQVCRNYFPEDHPILEGVENL